MAVAGVAWGDDVLVYTLDGSITGGSNGYATESEITQNGVTWMVMGNTTMNPWRIGGKNLTNEDRPLYSTSVIGENISRVVVTNGTVSSDLKVNSISLIVSSNADFSNATSVEGVFAASSTTTFEKPEDEDWTSKYFKIVYNVTAGSSNVFVQFVKAEFYKATSNPTCDAPEFSPVAGTYTSAQNVTISTTTEDASIYYTLDDSEPSATNGNLYSEPISVSSTTTIKAVVVKDGYNNSTIESATYSIVSIEHAGTESDPYTVADARNAIDVGTGLTDVYATGIVSSIPTAYSSSYGNITFNFVDPEGDNEFLQAYRCTGDDVANVAIGDTVVVKGTLTKYGSTYEFGQGCTLVSLTHPEGSVEKPTFTPEAGTYTEAQRVTISCATDGATIYYTTDGTEPTNASTQYTGEISVSQATTIKAIAIKGETQSVVATATYHICSSDAPYTVAQALAFNEYPANGIYVHGIVSTAPTQAPTDDGQLTYYISDNGEATDQLQVYKGKGLEQAAFEAQNDIQVGDVVTIYGNVKIYSNTKEFDTNNYLVSFERPVITDPVINASNVTLVYNAINGEIAYTIDNPVEGTSLTATLEEGVDWITDVTVDAENSKVFFTTTANEGTEDRTATITLTYGEVTKDVTVTQGHYVADYATLPFEFDGGKADVDGTAGLTQNDLGGDYGSSPKLKFDGTGDYLILHFDGTPGKLTFDIKGNSFSGGTFTVQTSEDGETYADLETYTTLSDTQSEEFNNLGENVRYIKWIYTEKSSGNVALGNIVLNEPSNDPIINAEDLTIEADATSGEISYTITNSEEGTSLTASTETEWITNVSVGTEKVTFTTTANEGAERTGTITLSYGSVSKDVTITQKRAVVSGEVKYELVTSTENLTDGQYLIVSSLGEYAVAFDGSLETLDAIGNNKWVEVSDNVIMASDEISFTITAKEGGYSIKSNSGYYIGNTSDANALKSDTEDNFVNSITFDEADANANIVSSKSYLRYNSASNQDRFRYFKSASYTNQNAIKLFKKISSTETVKGDVNGDDSVTIADVTALVNILLGKDDTTPYQYDHEAAADVDGEPGITVADVEALVNLVLKQTNE